jgi:dihydroorotate dehydrogenase (fumarate)
MVDLTSRYLGLTLRTPLVASSSPLTGSIDDLRRLEDAGIAAVVLPSLFEEQLTHESIEINEMLETGAGSFSEAESYFPELEDYDTGPDRYCRLIAEARRHLGIPVIASLNGTSAGGWVEYARLLAEAGASALELNVYSVEADPARDAAAVESRLRELVTAVRAAVELPLAIKLSPFFTSFAHVADGLVKAGADGLVLFNRFYQPDIDLEALEVRPRLSLSTSEELRLPLRWIAILHGRVHASLAATSGVHDRDDVLKALLAGADAVMLASALLAEGPELVTRLEAGLREWLDEREYESVRQLQGSMSQRACPDPSAFERSNYVKALRSWSSGFRT